MNYLVFLNAQASELEKILSGTKSMVVREVVPTHADVRLVAPGDSLYFLRNKDDCNVQVKATVTSVLPIMMNIYEDNVHLLNELQPKLQLTEEQYNRWTNIKHAQLVEFVNAHKIGPFHISVSLPNGRSEWVAFEGCDLLT
jgi:hypothetical protein